MSGWEVIGWVGIGCVALVLASCALAIAIVIVKSAWTSR